MFISIPREFFVPIKYESKVNMDLIEAEFIDKNSREKKTDVKSGIEYAVDVKKNIKGDIKNDLIYVYIDDEYVNDATKNKIADEVALKNMMEGNESSRVEENNDRVYEEIDEEYIRKGKDGNKH